MSLNQAGLNDPEDLSPSAFDEIHVPRHRLTDVVAARVLRQVVLKIRQRLELAFEDDRPVTRDRVDQHAAVAEAVLFLHRWERLLELRGQLAGLAGLALKDVADEIHTASCLNEAHSMVSCKIRHL